MVACYGEAGVDNARARTWAMSCDIQMGWRFFRRKRRPTVENVWMSSISERIVIIGFVAVKATSGL
ncbi:hypothetical protein WJ45_00205 [Burkholderia ubonensis]|nr:hypothetical protein WJ45_00205 [Burkholderia ubonensis]KVN75867.1 hypothetical protein WJ67_17590 [Burkholderia ubonensis]KVQ58617.1 hypothetical protein WK04_28435 [Burkholderia ubonensis]